MSWCCGPRKSCGRPVKWVADRSEAFVTDTQGRDNVTKLDLALDEQFRFLALSVELTANMGAYLSNFAPEIPTASGGVMYSGVYAFPAVHVAVKGVYTNTVPVDAYRGAGRPEAAYAVERLIDCAARRLGIEADELRRRNFIKPAAMPYKTPLGLTYDSGDFVRNLEDALAAADASGFTARREDARNRGRLRGLGHAVYIEQSGFPPDEFAELRFDPSGTLTLLMGTQSSGQGHQTAYAQLASEKLGLPLEKIRVLQGDTEAIGFGRGTGGSRSLPVGGAALFHAADKLIDKGRKIAAHMLEAAEADIAFADGTFAIAGTDRSVTLDAVARAAFNPSQLPPGIEPGFAESGHFTPPAPTFPNGCHVCEVEIDPDTGLIEIVRYLVVDDFGTVINPLLLAGQVHGGIAQGVGQAMLERTVYDPESGQLLTGNLTDYAVPHADTLPRIEFSYNIVPCRTNPLGVKGAGEAGAIGAPPALVNAVIDAVAEFGIDHLDMPLTPQRCGARCAMPPARPQPEDHHGSVARNCVARRAGWWRTGHAGLCRPVRGDAKGRPDAGHRGRSRVRARHRRDPDRDLSGHPDRLRGDRAGSGVLVAGGAVLVRRSARRDEGIRRAQRRVFGADRLDRGRDSGARGGARAGRRGDVCRVRAGHGDAAARRRRV